MDDHDVAAEEYAMALLRARTPPVVVVSHQLWVEWSEWRAGRRRRRGARFLARALPQRKAKQ